MQTLGLEQFLELAEPSVIFMHVANKYVSDIRHWKTPKNTLRTMWLHT
jgi:hypothetical protein